MVTNPSPSLVQTLNPHSPPSPISSSSIFLHLHYLNNTHSSKNRGHKLPSVSLNLQTSKQFLLLAQCTSSSSRNGQSYSSKPFPEIGLLYSFFQDIGLEEKETQLILDKNPSLQSTSEQSLQNRIISLQSVGINGLALTRSIAKCPDILTAHELEPVLRFIGNDLQGKINPEKLERFLTSMEPRFLVWFVGKVKLLIDCDIPQEKLVHVLNNVNLNKVFGYKSAQEIERSIVYLQRFGGAELIVRRPALLNIDLDGQLIPRVRVLVEISGGDENGVGVILRKLPAVLTYRAEHLRGHVQFMRSFAGLSNEEIFKIVMVYPNVFSVSKERKLHPRVEFLKQCGLNSNDIFKFLVKAPLFLSLSFEENLSKKLGFLVKIGYENRTKELAIAMGAVTRTSCENMQKMIGVFLDFGLACEDIYAMSKKHPQILQYNHKSIQKKMEYLIDDMGREIGELLAFPAFLGYKLDDRIIHRYEEKKKILGEGMSINKLLSVSSRSFSKKKSEVLVKHKEMEDELPLTQF